MQPIPESRPTSPQLSSPGTYLLMMKLASEARIRIGRLGAHVFHPGVYAYSGSARGPGGIGSRIRHHLRAARRPHWHLDYLRPHVRPVALWYLCTRDNLEHRWAQALSGIRGARIIVPGFGASDCACATHLVYLSRIPSLATFRRHAGRVRGIRRIDLEP